MSIRYSVASVVVALFSIATPFVQANEPLPAFQTALQKSEAAIKQASVELETASARQNTLVQLLAEGNASRVELEKANVRLATATATLDSYKRFQSFVKELMNDENAINELRSDKRDGSPKLVVTIPGLNEAVGCLQLGSMTVPATDPLTQITMKITQLRGKATAEKNRLLAENSLQQQLVSKLQLISTNAVEIKNAQAKLTQTEAALQQAAVDHLAASRQQALLAEMLQSNGERYRLNTDVAAALQMESLRQQNTATQVAYRAERSFRERHLEKLMAIADSGAVPQAEMQFSEYQVQYLAAMLNQTDVNAARLQTEQHMFAAIRSPKSTEENRMVTVAFDATKLPTMFSHLTSKYLSDALAISRERLIDSAQVGGAASRVAAYGEYVNRLGLSANDSFFDGERLRSRMLLNVAEGSLAELQFERKTRQLEYLFVDSLNEAAAGQMEASKVMDTLEDLFKHRANLSKLKEAAESRVAYRLWKSQQTDALRASGDASWLEMAKRRRDLKAAEADVQQLNEQSEIRSLEMERFQMIKNSSDATLADKSVDSLASAEE